MRNPLLYSDNVRQSTVQTFQRVALRMSDKTDSCETEHSFDREGKRISFAVQGG